MTYHPERRDLNGGPISGTLCNTWSDHLLVLKLLMTMESWHCIPCPAPPTHLSASKQPPFLTSFKAASPWPCGFLIYSPYTFTSHLQRSFETSTPHSRLAPPTTAWISMAMNSLQLKPSWEARSWFWCALLTSLFVLHSVPWLKTWESSGLLLSLVPPTSPILQNHKMVTSLTDSQPLTSFHRLLHLLPSLVNLHLPLRL